MKVTDKIIQKYSEELGWLKNYLLKDLEPLNIESAAVFGSAVYQECFDESLSDIDIVAFSDAINHENSNEIIELIAKTSKKFGDKAPVYVADYVSPRIEFVLETEFGITFDVNLFPTQMHGLDNMKNGVLRDTVDMIIGAMYLNGITFFGTFPYQKEIEEKMMPFYSDELRLNRLEGLKVRILSCLNRLQKSLEKDQRNSFYFIYKIHPYVMRFLFMLYRYYPISTEKHLEEQLSEIGLSNNQINTLLLRTGHDYREIVLNFISIVYKFVETYSLERKVENE